MIITVSIVDAHKPKGQCHVGTYTFEIDYPGDSHFDFFAMAIPVKYEDAMRPHVGRLMTKADMEAAEGWARVSSKTGKILELSK